MIRYLNNTFLLFLMCAIYCNQFPILCIYCILLQQVMDL